MASKEDVARFLYYISQLESSGGQNTDHPVMESGIHKGDSAQGKYGVMPKTMDELKKRYPKSFTSSSGPDDYAQKLAERVLQRSDMDETLAAGMWNQGHNTQPENFDKIRDSNYAKKYEEMRKQIPEALDPNPYIEQQKDFLKLKEVLKGKK